MSTPPSFFLSFLEKDSHIDESEKKGGKDSIDEAIHASHTCPDRPLLLAVALVCSLMDSPSVAAFMGNWVGGGPEPRSTERNTIVQVRQRHLRHI